jgi:hypothetical protein
MGSEFVEAINSIAGERCSPHPHVFSDRLIRPGDQAYFDIIHVYNGYRTCYYRTFVVGRATQAQRDAFKRSREWMDAAIDLVKPGTTTDQIAAVWPKAEEFGFEDEMDAFGLQFGHGVGVGLHERPIISRLNSFDDPIELKEGMLFALETYCPASDGRSAARIEEEVVVTAEGPRIITLFSVRGADGRERVLSSEPRASRIARHTFSGVYGGSRCVIPRGASASATAFATAAGMPIEPLSPSPFAPSGFSGEGVSWNSLWIGGTSGAPGMPYRVRFPVSGCPSSSWTISS